MTDLTAVQATNSSMYPQNVDFAVLDEIRDTALKNMSPDLTDYLEGGAGTEVTLRANRSAFGRWVVRHRPMSGVSAPRTATTFLGIPLSVPILTAPFGGDGLFHEQGHLAVARANAVCGTASIVPEAGTFSYAQVAEVAPTAARVAQLHPVDDHFEQSADQAREAGYSALCVTVDCQTAGYRVRNRRNRFNPDLTYFSGNQHGGGLPRVAEMFERLLSVETPTWDWNRLAEVTQRCGMPWIAKGILTAEAADEAIRAGAAAIVVSNHGGRQLDPAPASVEALPEVAAAVAGRVPIALDSGVRTGSDIFTALALGASAVLLGRLAIYGLAADGEVGVRRTIELLTEELRTIMMIAGVPDVADLDATAVRKIP